MSLRRTAALLLALVAACAKDVTPESSPAFVDYAVFDPSTGDIPLPNDLALANAASLPDGAQKELLLRWAADGGFPNDIEVPITIGFTRATVSSAGSTLSAPSLDLTTIRPPGDPAGATLALFRTDVFPPVPAAYQVAGQSTSGATTTLTLRAPAASNGSRNWPAGGQFVVAVRGGPNGVKTQGGGQIQPEPTMYLLLAGRNLADPANQALLPDPSAGVLLELIRQSYLPAFQLVDGVFDSKELAVLQTFQIAPSAGTVVSVDETAGAVPLPFDLLRTDPDGTIINNPAFGPAAPGLDTLDGFSTTAMMLAPTSGPIDAGTVPGNVFLFELGGTGPTLVKDLGTALAGGTPGEAVYVPQPPAINQACASASGTCSTVIGLQPAVPAPVLGTTYFLPPLKEQTDYAVVITKGVEDLAGNPLARSTIAKTILDLASPVAIGGVSQLAGVDDATATGLETMRGQLAPVYSVLPGGKTKADVAMAYTFRTQSVTPASLQLSALPYGVEQGAQAAVFTPLAASQVDVAAAYGVTPGADVDSYWSVTTPTLDAIDTDTGALRADLATLDAAQLAALVKPLPALVAVPLAASAPSCGFPPPLDALHCAKLVVFVHGLTGSRLQMLNVANELAAHGFVVAAIDLPLHGDRAYCSTDADCNAGGTCDLIPGGDGQGDANPPGICSNGNLRAGLTTVASGRYFVSANFFRSRDTLRQNLIDQSALVLSLARPPAPLAPQPGANPFSAALLAKNLVVDPSAVYLEGISLGAIAGTNMLATNPRLDRGVLSVGGGTLVDVFTNAPAFQAQVDALLLSLGIDRSQIPNDPEVAAAYLKIINVAKWILDPSEPVNFAKHVATEPLPNLLSPTPALQAAKDAWGMVATNDTVIPNAFNLLLYENAAIPFSVYASASAPGGTVPHSFLATSLDAQQDAALWLVDPVTNLPPPLVTLP